MKQPSDEIFPVLSIEYGVKCVKCSGSSIAESLLQ